MRLYANWLEGEYLRIAGRYTTDSPIRSAERFLKLHALFGTNLVLSDTQIMDSAAIMECFADPSFRRFLNDDDEFLELVARPQGDSANRFAIGTAGLHRALEVGWASSAFDSNSEITRQMAELVIAKNAVDVEYLRRTDEIRNLLRDWKEYEARIIGLLYSVQHFASGAAPVSVPPDEAESLTYFEILEETAKQPGLTPEDRGNVDMAKHFVEQGQTDEDDKKFRSRILERLDDSWPREHRVVWHTISHAWNYAVQRTLCPDGGSVAPLPNSTAVGIYLDQPTDALVPFERRGDGLEEPSVGRVRVLERLGGDPASLPWERIREIVLETKESQQAFQSALSSQEEADVEEAGRAHAQAISARLAHHVLPDAPPLFWLVGKGVCIAIGGLIEGLAGGTIGGIIAETAEKTYPSLRDVLKTGHRYLIADTLHQAAGRYARSAGQ